MDHDLAPGVRMRRARPDDHEALLDICVRTGDSGRDATPREDDPTLVGLIYAVPWQVLEPDFAFLIEDAEGHAGYVLGTPDTRAFDARAARDWFPALRARVRDPGPDERSWRGSDPWRRAIHTVQSIVPPALDPYPAQAHIDLLPRLQGRGIGRLAFTAMLDRLAAAGAPGVHLQVSPQNSRALDFYARLGFFRLEAPGLPDHTAFMVRALR